MLTKSISHLKANKLPLQNDPVTEDELKYYLSNWEYNDLLEAVQELIIDYTEKLTNGFPGGGSGGSGGSGGITDPENPGSTFRIIKSTSPDIPDDESIYTTLKVHNELVRLEKEAYANDNNFNYRKQKKLFSFLKYL